MGVQLQRQCPSCGGRAKYVYSATNLLRTLADVLLCFVLIDLFKLWFHCTACGRRFKSE